METEPLSAEIPSQGFKPPDGISPQDSWNRTAFRWGAGLLTIGTSALLGVAAFLTPSKAGLGTHHQLGLPPCSVRMLFGIRCPSCGMTTSWAHFMDGNLIASAQANLGGLLLACFACFGCVIGAKVVWTGLFPSETTIRNSTIALIGIAIVTLTEWLVRLAW